MIQWAEGKMRVVKWEKRDRVGGLVKDIDRDQLQPLRHSQWKVEIQTLVIKTAEEERTAKRASKTDQGQGRAVRRRTNPRAKVNK